MLPCRLAKVGRLRSERTYLADGTQLQPSPAQVARRNTGEFDHGKRREFHTLNGLRGVAALLVVTIHAPRMFPVHPHHAYLAVDLFFVMSGFILSYVYGDRITRGLPLSSFMRTRVIRLAPLYFLALLLNGVLVWLDRHSHLHQMGVGTALAYLGFGILMIPAHLRVDSSGEPYPYNNVAWTLFLELVMNVVHCGLLRRVGLRTLMLLNLLAAASLVWFYTRSHNLNAGWQFGQLFTIGAARVSFSYTAGMLIYQAWRRRRLANKVPALITVALAALLLVVHTGHDALFALLFILLLLPLLVLVGVYNEPSQKVGRIFGALGFASYGVYVLQVPLLHFVGLTMPRIEAMPGMGLFFLLCLFLMAFVATKYYDTPARARIDRRRRIATP